MNRSHIMLTLGLTLTLSTAVCPAWGQTRQQAGQKGEAGHKGSQEAGVEFFENRIRPVLVRECFGCHSDRTGRIRGGLRLDTRQLLLTGGDSGPAVVPGRPADSLLLSAMNHDG